jgi:ATP-dependent DNA helicase RecG
VQWHDDRLEISNPGGFPEGVRLENLLVTPPRPRNPLLADACKRAGLVERTARGIDTIFAEQLRNGRPAPSYERSTERDVVLVLSGRKAHEAFIRLVIEASQSGHPLGLDELLVLHGLWVDRQLTVATAARLLQKPESEVRGVLDHMEAIGLAEGSGDVPARMYHLTGATYRRLAAEATSGHGHGGEPVSHEQTILGTAQQHGSITRQQTAILCRVSPYQATRLLGRLVKDGKLRVVGKGKGTKYLPSA